MIVSTIKQFGLRLRTDPEEIPFQYSANVQMKFEKDENYNDYTVVGYYIPPGQHEAKLLSINDDGTFILGPDCFKQRGTLSFSFNLINSQEEVNLGSIDFEVRYSFGDGDTILPEPEEVWIRLVAQVAKDAIKEEVALVKQKANEALQSASLANDKASEAKEYANNANQSANSANLSASSALTAKNDAIAASNSAIQAKQDAEQSANNAKNSANTALENANKSTEAIETVTQIKIEIENKANDFDTNYQEKLNAFNDNATEKQSTFNQNVTSANTNFDNKVTQANSDLDAKVQEANTIIDEKVKTATEQAQKAKEEANRAEQATDGKLDKNLGVENAGKSLVVGENGEIVCGESGINEDEVNKIIDKAIDEKLYTQEEVDYMLADKMDKPYVPITITDNATITDALEGNFKIDKIKGNTYQNVEENILPTPDRPVPINSRKVLANGEYVELRSLKETINKFDLGILSQTDLIPDDDTSYRRIKIPIKLKPNTKYKFYYEKSMIPALSWVVLNIINDTGKILIEVLNVDNKENNEVEKQAVNVAFTSPADGEIYFSYYVASYNLEGALLPVNLTTFREKWFTKYLKNIMITEDSLNQTTYIPPTVRDYKIIDHTNKTAKIIRNVGLYVDDKTGDSWTAYDNQTFQNSYFKNIKDMKRSNRILSYSNSFEVVNENTGVGNANSMWIGVTNSNVFVIRTDFKTIEEWKTWLKNNDLEFLYPLITPVEESIAYVETDVSEVGYSWQDTTSPSPTIKSEVRGVEEIDILKTGKNLFDIEYVSNLENWTNPNSDGYFYIPIKVPKGKQLYLSNDKTIAGGRGYYANFSPYKDKNMENYYFFYHTVSGSAYGKFSRLTKDEDIYLRINSITNNLPLFIEDFKHLQLEVGDTATAYEPYTEQHVNYTPTNPLYSTQDGSTCDYIDVKKGVEVYNMSGAVVFDGSDDELWRLYASRNGFYIQLNDMMIGRAHQGFCDEFKIVSDISLIGIILGQGNNFLYVIQVNSYATTIEEWKTWLSQNPIAVVYPLVSPTEIPIPPENLEKLKSLKTNAGVNNIFVGGEIKPSIEARYPQDVVSAVNTLQTRLLTLQEEVIKNV